MTPPPFGESDPPRKPGRYTSRASVRREGALASLRGTQGATSRHAGRLGLRWRRPSLQPDSGPPQIGRQSARGALPPRARSRILPPRNRTMRTLATGYLRSRVSRGTAPESVGARAIRERSHTKLPHSQGARRTPRTRGARLPWKHGWDPVLGSVEGLSGRDPWVALWEPTSAEPSSRSRKPSRLPRQRARIQPKEYRSRLVLEGPQEGSGSSHMRRKTT
jgi:hypothetical protein